jgi:BolA protein
MDRVAWIETALTQAFAPSYLVVEDDSALHAGHAGAASGGGHFRVLIVAETFRGQSPVARQRAVYAALGDAMKSEIHALALRTLTPDEWSRQRT